MSWLKSAVTRAVEAGGNAVFEVTKAVEAGGNAVVQQAGNAVFESAKIFHDRIVCTFYHLLFINHKFYQFIMIHENLILLLLIAFVDKCK